MTTVYHSEIAVMSGYIRCHRCSCYAKASHIVTVDGIADLLCDRHTDSALQEYKKQGYSIMNLPASMVEINSAPIPENDKHTI